jgi:hypothetical protein
MRLQNPPYRQQLKFDPLAPLLFSKDEALLYYVKRDLLGKTPARSIDCGNCQLHREF